MKKIIFIFVLLSLIGGGVCFYLNRAPKTPATEVEKWEWCYGVYHASKPEKEVERHDTALFQIRKYADLDKSSFYEKGIIDAATMTIEQKAECYDRVYTVLADVIPSQTEPVRSKPYCFGYLSVGRGIDAIRPFCRVKCQRNPRKNCEKICEDDLRQNLKQDRLEKGKNDAVTVDPKQYSQCLTELKTM